MITEHDAGPLLEDGTQPCRRCGGLLTDNRGTQLGEGLGALGPLRWGEGPVYQSGHFWSTTRPTGESILRCRPGERPRGEG